MKESIFFAILLFWTLSTFSQQDPKAKAVLDKLASESGKHECIEVQFTYTITNLSNSFSNDWEGTLVLKNKMYHLSLMGVETFFDGTTLWNYIIDANEVNITVPDPNNKDFFLSDPNQIFSIYNTDFKQKYIGETTDNGVKFHEIDLYPKDIEGNSYSRYKLVANDNTNSIHSIAAFGKNGNIYIVEIKDYITNSIFEDTYFSFNKEDYPGVEIIDLR
ncbi:MAG: outer membrane lipoprotein carrier protein LolA [Bacteroidales bacterium]|nr:outer membrane lipoprotein carrier protein LolA [Bacteroidales bacterium]